MDAEGAWRFWQRLLRSDEVLAQLREVAAGVDVGNHFPHAERQIATYYAARFKGTELCVTTFRFRMKSAFGHCLQSAAPLSYRALVQAGVDMENAGIAFQEWSGWIDYGPRVNTGCAAAIAFLRQWDGTPRTPGFTSLFVLEEAAVELTRRMATAQGGGSLSEDARVVGEPADLERARLEQTGTAVLVDTEHALSAWLRDRSSLGTTAVPRAAEWYLVYFPSPAERHRLLRLSELGARVYRGEATDSDWCRRLQELGVLQKANT